MGGQLRIQKQTGYLASPDSPFAHCGIKLVAGEGFEPSTFGLCVPLQLSLPGWTSSWSGLSLHPRLARATGRVPAIKSLHLLKDRYGHLSLARGYPANGFPDFDR